MPLWRYVSVKSAGPVTPSQGGRSDLAVGQRRADVPAQDHQAGEFSYSGRERESQLSVLFSLSVD